MKQKIMLCALMLSALVLASCGSEAEYSKFIPKESSIVGRIDVAQIAEKGGFGDNDQVADILNKAIKTSGLSAKGKVVAEKIIADPALTGLDLRKPVFFYKSDDSQGEHFGVIATVLNKSDLNDFFNYLSTEFGGEKTKEYKDVNYIADGDVLAAFNDTWLVIKDIQNGSAQNAIDALLTREDIKPEQTIESEACYKRMLEGDGLAQLVVRGSMFAGAMSQFGMGNGTQNIKDAASDFDYIFDLKSDKGELSLDFETFAASEEGRNRLAQSKKFYDEIQGEYADYIDQEALFTLVGNLHGKEVVKFLEESGMGEIGLNQFSDYLAAINGDVVFTMNALKANLNGLDSRMFLQVSSPQPYLGLRSALGNVPGLNEFSPNEFSLSLGQLVPIPDLISEMKVADENASMPTGNILFNFGVNNNRNVYAAFSLNSNAFDKVKNPISKDTFHGRSVYMRFNSTNAIEIVRLIAKNNGDDNSYDFKIGMNVMEQINYAELYVTTDQKAKLCIKMRNEDKNGLATLVGVLANIASLVG